jgi:hypothetical protein
MSVTDDLIEALQMRVAALEEKLEYYEELEKKVVYLEQLIDFWHGPVPQKYKKFNPASGEYPFFKKEEEKPDILPPLNLGRCDPLWPKIEIPSDPEVLKKTKKRFFSQKSVFTEFSYEIITPERKTILTTSQEDAKAYIAEHPECTLRIRELKIPKPASSEASSASSQIRG